MEGEPTPKQRDEELIRELTALGASKLDAWRYFSDRADKFTEQIWTTGTWMFGIIAAVLVLPFGARLIVVSKDSGLRFEVRPIALLICLFGILLCAYTYTVLKDMREHIERNWRRADLARTGQWRDSQIVGRKLHVWLVLMVFVASSTVAFVSLAALALVW